MADILPLDISWEMESSGGKYRGNPISELLYQEAMFEVQVLRIKEEKKRRAEKKAHDLEITNA